MRRLNNPASPLNTNHSKLVIEQSQESKDLDARTLKAVRECIKAKTLSMPNAKAFLYGLWKDRLTKEQVDQLLKDLEADG